MFTFPVCPCDCALASAEILALSRVMTGAVILILPALPAPEVDELINALLRTVIERLFSIVMMPALPELPESVSLCIEPLSITVSSLLTVILPALPVPEVNVVICPPFDTVKLLALRLTVPALPALASTAFRELLEINALLPCPSTEIVAASMTILPA